MKLTKEGVERLIETATLLGYNLEQFSEIFFEPPLTIFDFIKGKENSLPGYAKLLLKGKCVNLEWLESGKGLKTFAYTALNPLDPKEYTLLQNTRELNFKNKKLLIQKSRELLRQSEIEKRKKGKKYDAG